MSVVSCTVSAGLFGHPKFLRFCAGAGIDPARGLMMLVALWQGAISRLDEVIGDADDVERVMGWGGERGALVAALLEAGGPGRAGLVEQSECGRLQLHDLWEWAPEAAVKRWRRATAGRGAVRRRLAPFGAERRHTSPAPSPAPPSPPSPSEEKKSLRGCAHEARPGLDRRAEFEAVLDRYPVHRRGVTAEAWTAWLALVRRAAAPDAAAVAAALERGRVEWSAGDPRMVPQLKRWLGSIDDWLQERPLARVVSIGRRGRAPDAAALTPWAESYQQPASRPPIELALVESARAGRVTAELERQVGNAWCCAVTSVDDPRGAGALSVLLDRLGRNSPRPLELADLGWLADLWQVDLGEASEARHG